MKGRSELETVDCPCHQKNFIVIYMLRLSTIKAIGSKTAGFRAVYCVRAFSTDKASGVAAGSEVLVYEGMFAKKMKWLRRISLGSTILSIAFMVSHCVQLSASHATDPVASLLLLPCYSPPP
jgi:hypothetical protein